MKIRFVLLLTWLAAIGSAQAAVRADSLLSTGKSTAMLGIFSTSGALASFSRLSQAVDNVYNFSGLNFPVAASVLSLNAETLLLMGDELVMQTVSEAHQYAHVKRTALREQKPVASSRNTGAAIHSLESQAGLSDEQTLPKPETWALLLVGLGLISLRLRHNNAGSIAIG